MGIFTRMRDIVSSNINVMLDRAEDPEKLIRLMIQEMEDTLVEIKASCAQAMAAQANSRRQLDQAVNAGARWEGKAALALDKGREDLAREALVEKRRYDNRRDSLEREYLDLKALVDQYQDDIVKLEEKLGLVREKQRILIQRHLHAQHKYRAEQEIRKVETSDAWLRFDKLQNRVERMEAEADLVNLGRKPDLETEFDRLATDEGIERELEELRRKKAPAADQA